VVVVPGALDWSVEEGAVVDVSAGGELAEPAGEVDSCLEQADNSASEVRHNNRALRFIRSPHNCNGSVTRGRSSTRSDSRVASGVPAQPADVASVRGTQVTCLACSACCGGTAGGRYFLAAARFFFLAGSLGRDLPNEPW
jgi:hypothetical protein